MGDTRKLFVVTDDGIHLGRESLHKKLVENCGIEDRRVTFGGGCFEQKDGRHFILFGESGDFGKFAHEIVNIHIKNKNVYWYNRRYEEFTFEIDLDREEKQSDRF